MFALKTCSFPAAKKCFCKQNRTYLHSNFLSFVPSPVYAPENLICKEGIKSSCRKKCEFVSRNDFGHSCEGRRFPSYSLLSRRVHRRSYFNQFGNNTSSRVEDDFSRRLEAVAGNALEENNELTGTKILFKTDQSRGGYPRFFIDKLPVLEGASVRMEGPEFLHLSKSLRLGPNDCVELFDSRGGVVEARVLSVQRNFCELQSLHPLQRLSPSGPQWQVAAACGTLKGGRADWLVEKCTELGASSLLPLLTERSPRAGEGRVDRWQRVALAAAKQCQRLHGLEVKEPCHLSTILSQVASSPVTLVAAAESPPLLETVSSFKKENLGGLLLVGPEGDFSESELSSLIGAGAILVGLGPRRLRVETAALTMLAGVMLFGDTQKLK